MRRREFIAGLGGAAIWPLAVSAQETKLPVIGHLIASTLKEVEEAFATRVAQRVGAVQVTGDPTFFTWREQLAAMTVRYRVPAIYVHREIVEAGGLISYATDYVEGYRTVGNYTARILKGEEPADLTVQQATKSELVINLRTAEGTRHRCAHRDSGARRQGDRMRRREFIAGLGGAVAWPLLVRAQQQTKPVIGWLEAFPGGTPPDLFEAFRRGLAEFGFSDGRDVTVESHNIAGYQERLPPLVADVVRRRPAAIIAIGVGAALAAKAATRDIPIIFFSGIDPVELGLVASLNRPGGNITGVAFLNTDTAEKRLELLHTAAPAAEAIAVLVGPAGNLFDQAETRAMQSAARTLGLHLLIFNVTVDTEIAPVFARLVEQRAGAVLVSSSIIVSAKFDQILSHALRFALPTMFAYSIAARAGGLSSYGPDFTEAWRQIAVYTGRILKGEKPADLPVVRSNRFEFVINLKTAKALGLNLPPDLVAIADEVIE